MDNQARELNDIIEKNSQSIISMLSERGKNIFFPKKGILSQSMEAKGKKINATIGEAVDDDGKPMFLKSINSEVTIPPEQTFPYAPSSGKPDLRTKWKEMLFEKNPSLKGKNISLPVTSCALTHGLSISGYMFVNEEDTILIPDLYWENYDLVFVNGFGGKIKKYNLFDGSKMDLKSLESCLDDGKIGKKILLLNFPNNPTGYTPTKKETAEITAIIKKSADKGNKIVVIIDDAYFGLVYEDDIISESLFSSLSDIHENVLAVKLDGPTKEDYVWGFRVGFITFGIKGGNTELYNALEQKISGAIRGNISNVAHVSQSLLYNAYSSSTYQNEKKEKYERLKSRYNIIKNIFEENKKYNELFSPLPYNSGYFMCIKLNGIDGEELRKVLINEYNTGVINMSGVIRIAYSSVNGAVIPELFENIYQAALKLKK